MKSTLPAFNNGTIKSRGNRSIAILFVALVIGSFVAPAMHAAADLWIRDDINDVGNEPNNQSATLYLSDDIWIRRTADPNYDPHPFPTATPTWIPLPHEGPCYRNPKTGSPNYMYVRIRNRGNTASAGTETLHAYWAKASTGLNWSGDWNDHLANPCGGPLRLYGYQVTKPRKNGATATPAESADYVAAIQTIDTAAYQFPDLATYFDKQNGVHSVLFGSGIHNSLRFLPWHRELMNRYEALLREVKPALTLLYWDWTTDPSPTIVGGAGYMGVSNGAVGPPFPAFGLTRNKGVGAPGAVGLQPVYQSGTLLPSASFAGLWGNIEVPAHNAAHNYMGGTIASINAARDPMFFMLHANCDRIWSLWQRLNVNRWTPGQAYDASQANVAITANLRPWDGTDAISPWLNQIPGDPNGYVIFKPSTHHSIVFPPIYDDALLRIPVLAPGECAIIEIPFYPPPLAECGTFVDPQHLCLLARIEPVSIAEGPALWLNVKNNNNIAWRNVTLSDCNIGPFFLVAPGRIGAAGQLVRDPRPTPAVVTLRFDEAQVGFRSLFEYGHVRLRLSQDLIDAWVAGGRQGQGVEQVSPTELLVVRTGATIAGMPLAARQTGHMDLALELNRGYPHPFGDVYRLNVTQYDNQGGTTPVGGQGYDLDFNLLELVRKGSDWKFLDGGAVPGASWQKLTYDDQTWKKGTALFGYGRTDAETTLNGTATGTAPAFYFRQVFTVPDPTFFQTLALNLFQDDGVVVYLNGEEIARLNMPAGVITPDTKALAPMLNAAARACRTVHVNEALGLLVPGNNVLAAEIHPAAPTAGAPNPDLSFDLRLAGNVPPYPYQPPTVVITTPLNGDLIHAQTGVPIVADVVDPDGDLLEVRIFVNGELLVRHTSPPFTASIDNAPPGVHRVSVQALDQFGHSTRMESVFTAVTNLLPTVSITQPLGGMFAFGAPVLVVADAADPDGSVAKVQFFIKSHATFGSPRVLAGTDSTPPYSVQVAGLAPGMYMATAEATDNQGAVGHSLVGHFLVTKPMGVPLMGIRGDYFGNDLVLTLDWALHEATLEHTTDLHAPWTVIPDALSPFLVGVTEPTGFFRLRVPVGACGCGDPTGQPCTCVSCNCHP